MSAYALALMLIAPLAGAVANGINLFAGDRLFGYRAVQAITLWSAVAAFAGAAALLVLQMAGAGPVHVSAFRWFDIAGSQIHFAFLIDPLAAVMAALVAGFGAVIAKFSVNYMFNETGFTRYFATYSLFLFAMLLLVTSDNLLTMFIGWEGVGICSYLLIGHYQERHAAARAATEAFIANRVGDAGLILAIVILLAEVGTVAFADLGPALATAPGWVAPAAAACLLVGVMGKSAQVPLGGWLGRAMEGPTPSSALIHAATMVTAGVYLMARAHVVFDAAPAILTVAAIVGALTALYGALVGQVSNDIKGVLASSTTMHLGLMILLCGLGAYGVAIFYLLSHAFYKSYKFLTAPSILHHLHGKLDFTAEESRIETPGWLVMAAVVGTGMVTVPLLLAVLGPNGEMGAAGLLVVTGGGLLALAVIARLSLEETQHGFSGTHDHRHGEEADHHHHHDDPRQQDHDHGHDSSGVVAPLHVTPVVRTMSAILLLAVAGVILQLIPGGAAGTWFGAFLGWTSQWSVAAPESVAPTMVLAVLIAVLAAHAVLSAMFLTRGRAERRVDAQLAGIAPLYVAAANRFWIDALIANGPVRGVAALSTRLGMADRRLERAIVEVPSRGAEGLGSAVRLFDEGPRAHVERSVDALGRHMGEAGSVIETRLVGGAESVVGWSADSVSRAGLLAERGLSRPVTAVVLIVFATIVVLAGV